MDLIPRMPGKPGRRQSVTAKAWITRQRRNAPFLSRVSLGKGRIYERSTETRDRTKALAFNRLHLLELLKKQPSEKPCEEEQLDLLTRANPAA